MVLQKRLEYGFNGYQVPPTPRATRSARRRVPFRKKVDHDQMSAFDLLATVAGKLLLEGDKTPSSTEILTAKENCAVGKDSIKKEQLAEDNLDKVKVCDEGSRGRNFFVSEIVSQAPGVKSSVKELSHAQNDAFSALASVVTNSDCSEKFSSSAKLVNGEHTIEHGNYSTNVDVEFYLKSLSLGSKLDDKNKKHIKIEPPMTGKEAIGAKADMFCSEDPIVWDVKPPALASFDTSVKLPVRPSFRNESPQKTFWDQNPCGSFPTCRDNVKLVSRDDDENSFGCTQPSTLNKALRQPLHIGGRKIRRLLVSKYWKAPPKLKDEERFSTETKSVYHNRVNCYKRLRSLRDYPLKKRRLYDRSLLTNADERVNSDDTSGSPGKDSSEDASGSVSTMHEAIGASAFTAGQQTSFQPRDSHVKLKIKSFRVPELFIEIPETATIGSLKRTVMEAVTAILSGGLRVGVVLQGKKIRDDNKTLVQTGIAANNKIDALGFTLEPGSSQLSPSLCPEDHSFILPCDTPQPLTRCPRAPIVVQQGTSDVSQDIPIANFGNIIESDRDSAPSPPDMSTEKSMTDSRALVAVPEMIVEALAVVPMRKSKRLDVVGQRRIRRPFSVSEVEALVQAVEKLGTGRWRDVKLRAFDNAKHRTYVDLKDKWKTLVHTARISPQQRRGEPVPQELLDRVLAAHAFWSQQQAKQQLKQHSEACLLF